MSFDVSGLEDKISSKDLPRIVPEQQNCLHCRDGNLLANVSFRQEHEQGAISTSTIK
jgi:hypothetical protein